jgi:hypothetical protein
MRGDQVPPGSPTDWLRPARSDLALAGEADPVTAHQRLKAVEIARQTIAWAERVVRSDD